MLLYSHSAVSDSLVTPYREPTRLLCLWDRPGKNSGVSCHFPLQGIFWPRDGTRVFCIGRQILYHWATWEAWCYNICLQLHFCDWLRYLIEGRDYTFVCFWFLKSAMAICLTIHTSLIFLSEHYLIKFMELGRNLTLEKLQILWFYAIFPKG